MYSPGDTLYLPSESLTRADLMEFIPAGAPVALSSSGRTFGAGKRADRAARQPLIYQMLITHAYTPFTMSEVCRVRLTGVYESPAVLAPFIPLPTDGNDTVCNDSSPGGSAQKVIDSHTLTGPEYIIKLYDPRCSVNVREQFDEGRPYSMEKAVAYHKYHRFQPAPYLSELFMDMPDLPRDPWTESDIGLFEAWVEVDARRTFERELSVYDLLTDLQGSVIPKVFDAISCFPPFIFPNGSWIEAEMEEHQVRTTDDTELGSPVHNDRPDGNNTLDGVDLTRLAAGHRVFGILMEFVPGFSLRSLIHFCLRSGRPELRKKIASIADEAVALILKIGSFPLRNRDIRLDNMLVRQSYVATLGLDTANTSTDLVDTNASTSDLSISGAASGGVSESAAAFRCVAIDFGQVRLRFDDETDEQWRCAKAADDEEARMFDLLAWEIQQGLKEVLGHETSLEGEDHETLLNDACEEEQKKIWNYKRLRPWYRELSPEEMMAYIENPSWGQHPKNWF